MTRVIKLIAMEQMVIHPEVQESEYVIAKVIEDLLSFTFQLLSANPSFNDDVHLKS